MDETISRLWKLEQMLRKYQRLDRLDDFRVMRANNEIERMRLSLQSGIKALKKLKEMKKP